jgi:flagellar basal-body rod protein FlgB
MPPVSGIGSSPPVQSTQVSGGATRSNAGESFSTALVQATSQLQGDVGHDTHVGGTGTNSPAAHSGPHNASINIPNASTDLRHFRISGSNHGTAHSLHETALGLREYRLQLIASNIANADTPGYKAVDIDLQETLRNAIATANTSPLPLFATVSNHVLAQTHLSTPPYLVKQRTPLQASADGNTVDMDVERSKFGENALMWQVSMDRVSGHFKMMMELFRSLIG